MADETDKKIENRIKEIFPHPETASAVVNLIVNKRPPGWSRKSNATYYKEIYARQMQKVVDEMLKTGAPITWRYSVWCDEDKGGMSKNTLYVRVNQSIRYLIDYLDPDGRYRKWYERTKVERHDEIGVIVRYIPGLAGTSEGDFKPDILAKDEEKPRWQRRMDAWLEGDEVTPLIIEGLALTSEEVKKIKVSLAQVTHVMASITSTTIKLVKVNA